MTGPTSKSRFVCQRCGQPVGLGRGNVYKHLVGWRSPRTCGLPPIPVLREPDLSDIPEVGKEWFKRAKLRRMRHA